MTGPLASLGELSRILIAACWRCACRTTSITDFSFGASVLLAATPLALAGCAAIVDPEVATTVGVDTTVMAVGAAMYPSRQIIGNAINTAEHLTLIATVKTADLTGTLSRAEPFTLFAPTDAAFEMLVTGTVERLLPPDNEVTLQSILTHHVVPGLLPAADLMRRIAAGRGSARFTSVAGGTLSARMMAVTAILIDGQVGKARFTRADVMESNGTIHVTDSASLPE